MKAVKHFVAMAVKGRDNGYATSSFGKDHIVPLFQNSQANTTWEPQS